MHGRPVRSASQRARATALAALCSVYSGPRNTPTCCPVTTQVLPGRSSAAMASSRAREAGSDAACRCSSATTPCIVRRRPARSAASSHAAGSIGRAGRSDAASSSPAMNCAKKSEAMPDCTVPVPMHPSKRARRAALAPMAFTLLLSTANAAPTLRPSQPDGARLERWLDRLLVVGGVLYVAAHPDDENTRLLAYLSNHSLLRTGYLSVTRGDGGQNLIGPEQGPGLGLIRTQELLAARRDRRRRAVLHPRARLRLLEERRGDAGASGAMTRCWPTSCAPSAASGRTSSSPASRPRTGETHGHHTASATLARRGVRPAPPIRVYIPSRASAASDRGRRGASSGTSAASRRKSDAELARFRSSTWAATTRCSGSRIGSSPPTAAACTRARASERPAAVARRSSRSSCSPVSR